MKFLWLVLSVSTAIIGFIDLFRRGIDSAYVFFIMALLSLMLYFVRNRLEKNEKNK